MVIESLGVACRFADCPTLELIVPDDFAGPLVIVQDPHGENVQWRDGHARLRLPCCGVIRVQDFAIFRDQKNYDIRRENGERIPDEAVLDDSTNRDTVALRFGRWNSRGGAPGSLRGEFFIGTVAEFHAFDFSTFPTPSCDETAME